jgi:SAM-dependent methyltransferase
MQEREAYTGVENLEVMQEAKNYNRYLLNLVRAHAPPGGRMIDFGAGGGTFALPMAAAGFDVTAVEPDNLLRGRLQDRKLKVAADVSNLADQSFAYVYTLNVLEHIEDDVGALRQLQAKLILGGRMLIYVPALPILYTSMDAKVGHVRRYTRATLLTSVRAAGFDVERVKYVDSIGFVATLLFKMTNNQDGNVNRTALKAYDRFVFPISRAVDLLARRWFGKNLLLIARKNPDA